MTTIACNRKEMACDSRASWDSEFATITDKVQRIGGSLVALSGSHNAGCRFLEWFKNRGEVPEFADEDKGFEAVVLTKAGIDLYINSTHPMRIHDPFYCTGSGGMAAKGAMACGKTPAQAVAIAIRFDKNSGGKVRNYLLGDDGR